MAQKKRYVQVGIGGRARFFYEAIAGRFSETSQLVGFCDINKPDGLCEQNPPGKVQHPRSLLKHTEFEAMIERKKRYCPCYSIDRTHHHYIIRAMELGCDVITENR